MTTTAERLDEVQGASSFLTVYHERVEPAERRLTRTGRLVVFLTVAAAVIQTTCASADLLEAAGPDDVARDLVCYLTAVMALAVTALWLSVIRDRRLAFGLLDRCAEIVEGDRQKRP